MTEKFAGGDFNVSYHTDSNDEMETLAESFNSMVKEIETLIDDIHREQENAKDAELRLLQEQINPHFLYNTLDAINRACALIEELGLEDVSYIKDGFSAKGEFISTGVKEKSNE